MIWVDKAKKYLWAISARNIDAMAELFADDITFANWGVYVQGKDAAVKANHDHIKLVKETKIEIKKHKSFEEAIKILKPPLFRKDKEKFHNHCNHI